MREGKPLSFPVLSANGPESPESRAARTVKAAWLNELAEGPAGVIHVPIRISHAIIEGNLELQSCTFESDLIIEQSEFAGSVYFDFATFDRRAVFVFSRFDQRALFDFARIHGPLVFDGAQFGSDASFIGTRVSDDAAFRGTQFGKRANFERVQVEGAILFDPSSDGHNTRFGGEARFVGARLANNANFAGAVFVGEAVFSTAHFGNAVTFEGAYFGKTARFDGVTTGGSIDFHSDSKGKGTHFCAYAGFIGARILGDANFRGARLDGETHFDSVEIEGSGVFSPDDMGNPVRFMGAAFFNGAHVRGAVEFQGAQFARSSSFEGAEIGLNALFGPDSLRNPVRFMGDALFGLVHVKGAAEFLDTQFGGSTDFHGSEFGAEVKFIRAHFRANADFEAARFRGTANFSKATFSGSLVSFGNARFEDGLIFIDVSCKSPTSFVGSVSEPEAWFVGTTFSRVGFHEAHFRTVFFRADLTERVPPGGKPQFEGQVDLRGFTYDRIGVAWREVLGRLDPYDRQPYIQMEQVFRSTGRDDDADGVYLERRRVERQGRGGITWFMDWVYWLFANYGIGLRRVGYLSLALLGFGTFLFSRAGAVSPQDNSVRGMEEFTRRVSGWVALWEGFWISVRYFLPVALPVPLRLVPTRRRVFFWLQPTTYANFLKVVGWILVPIGVAVLAGLLRRVAP